MPSTPIPTHAGNPSMISAATELAFIDTALEDWQTLQAGMPPAVEVVLLPLGADGLAVMQDAVLARQGLKTIHVLSHGTEGALHLGSAVLDAASLPAHAPAVAALGASLAADGDILLYGCNVAAGKGGDFLAAFAQMAAADVAASRTPTGAQTRGGDWDLDWRHGAVRAQPLRVEAYQGVMAPPQADEILAYSGESTVVIRFDGPLDASSQPAFARFVAASPGDMDHASAAILLNGTAVSIASAVVAGRTVTLSITPHTFSAGDYIEFRYQDPAGDDLDGVIQSTNGQDVLTHWQVHVVPGARPLTEPTLTATGATGFFVQGDAAGIDLFSGVTANTHNPGQVFTTLTLTVTGLSDADAESLGGIGLGVLPLTSGLHVVGADEDLVAQVVRTQSGQSYTATIQITSLSHTDSQLGALIDGLHYYNSSATVTPGERVISITSLSDNGATNNQSSLTGLSATVTVQAAPPPTSNTAPTLQLDTKNILAAPGTPTDLFDTVVADTGDTGQTFRGLVLSVHNVSGGGELDMITVDGTDITLSSNTGTTTHGSYTVTRSDGVATLTLSGLAMDASQFNALVDDISYAYLGNVDIGTALARPVVLRSITDSGATKHTTQTDLLSTVTVNHTALLPGLQITPVEGTVTLVPGETTQVSFTLEIIQSVMLLGTTLTLEVNAPAGWSIQHLAFDDSMPLLTGFYPVGTHTLTFDLTNTGDATSGTFPLSVSASMVGLPNTLGILSSAVMIDLGSNASEPAPVLQSATIDGDLLTLTYDVELDAAGSPLSNAFTVLVDGQPVSIAELAVSQLDKTVTLTLDTPVRPGQAVTVSYTDPSSGDDPNAIQNANGGADAVSLLNQTVVNNTVDTSPPVITSVSIPDEPAEVGDVVTATIKVSADADTYTLGAASINGFALSNLTKVDDTTYTATFTVVAGGTDLAADDDIAVSIILVDSASNSSTAFVTPITQSNDRIDTNAPPTLDPLPVPDTLVDTAGTDDFPSVFGQLVGHDPEGATLTYGYGGGHETGVFTVEGDPNGVIYDIASSDVGGSVFLNSVTGQYAYVFDSALLNSLPAMPLQVTSTFTVSDGNRTTQRDLTLNFTGANDSPILSSDVRYLQTIDQGIQSTDNTGSTVSDLLATAGTVTDAESDAAGEPLGIAITSVDTTNGTWQYKIGNDAWTNVPAVTPANALLLGDSDLVRFVPVLRYVGTLEEGLTFKAWDYNSGSAGSTVDTTTDSAFSVASATVSVRVDGLPIVTANGATTSVEAGSDTATDLFSNVEASTIESDQRFTELRLSVSGVQDGDEFVIISGTSVSLHHGNTLVLPGVGVAGGNASIVVAVNQTTAHIHVSGLELDDAQMSALIDSLSYQHQGSTPTLGDRTITLTNLTDNGGSLGTVTLLGVSATVTVEDTTPPSAPIITSVALSNSTTPTITGTAELGSTIIIKVGGATFETTAINGTWTLDLSDTEPTSGTYEPLENSENLISITATDPAGNTSEAATQTLVIDTTKPDAPAIASADLSNLAKPVVSGTAEAGSTVTLTVAGATYTVVAEDGTWSVNLATATPDDGTLTLDVNGSNTITVTATDPAGNTSDAQTQDLVIDTTKPVAPSITSASLTNTVEHVISGTAEPGSTVTVSIGEASYVVVAINGTWSVDLTTAPTTGELSLDDNGDNAISVTATDAAGNVSEPGTQTLVIDTTEPDAPAFTSSELTNNTHPVLQGTAEPGSTIVVTVGGATFQTTAINGTWTLDLSDAEPTSGTYEPLENSENLISITATDPAGNTSEAATQTLVIDTTTPDAPEIASADLSKLEGPTLSGTAEPGSTVTVTVAGAIYTVVAEDGTWSVDLATATPDEGELLLDVNGSNAVTVTATDPAGNTSDPQTQDLVIDTTLPEAPTGVVLPEGGPTNVDEVTVDLDSLEDGAMWQYSLDAGLTWLDGEGNSFVLEDGPYAAGQIQVRQVDAAGNPGESTQTSADVVIDTVSPTAPTMSNATLTSVAKPTLRGTAEAGSEVTVTVGNAVYSVIATDGNWSLNLASAVPTSGTLALNANGSNAISVTAKDTAGNLSDAGGQTLVIDTTPPAAPSLSFTAGAAVWDVAVSGLESGAQWQYRLPGGDWVAGSGNSFTAPLQAFEAGLIEVRQFDAAGNLGAVGSNGTALKPPFTDADGDGLPDDIEQGVPGMEGGAQGDGNGDGIPDIEQSDVTSLVWSQTPDGLVRYVTLTNDAGLTQQSVSTSVIALDTLPAALTLPLGALAFTVRDLPQSGIVNFSIFLDGDIPVNGYWKEIDGQWINLATSVTQVGGKTRIDFSIEDGGAFDADGERNGVIVDPGAPGWFDGDPFDTDGDQVPDRLEPALGLTVGTKDNDVFDREDLFVMQVYRDALGREAEQSGLTYWQALLSSGALDPADVVLQILANPEADAIDVLARLSFGLTGDAPAAEDLAAWRDGLARDETLDTLADAFVVTTYGNVTDSDFIDLLYQDALGRAADTGGHAYWVGQLAQGQSRGDVALEVLHSAEFGAAHGDDVALAGLYTALLGRAIDAAGLAYWGADVAAGKSLETVIVDIMGSTEYHDRFLPSDAG